MYRVPKIGDKFKLIQNPDYAVQVCVNPLTREKVICPIETGTVFVVTNVFIRNKSRYANQVTLKFVKNYDTMVLEYNKVLVQYYEYKSNSDKKKRSQFLAKMDRAKQNRYVPRGLKIVVPMEDLEEWKIEIL